MPDLFQIPAAFISIVAAALLAAVDPPPPRGEPAGSGAATLAYEREEPFVERAFPPPGDRERSVRGIAYGPHRDGQFPGGPGPTEAQIAEDLHLMAKRWGILRVYGSTGPSTDVLETIRRDSLDMKVVLGIWIAPEEQRDERGALVAERPEARAANRREIESAVRLAAGYPEIVAAVSVGNETQVSWSDHRCPTSFLTGVIREVRARTKTPVTVADDFGFWKTSESREIAREIDFLMTHHHPMWNGILLDDAASWVRRSLDEVQAAHPGRTLVIGETGWATRKHTEGDQARLIKGTPGEEQQEIFLRALTAWAAAETIPTFIFEAFDENWKGGAHPDEVEKHWGLFRADRSPKRAVSNND